MLSTREHTARVNWTVYSDLYVRDERFDVERADISIYFSHNPYGRAKYQPNDKSFLVMEVWKSCSTVPFQEWRYDLIVLYTRKAL